MRLTRRTFIMASGISAGALMTGCAGMAQAPLHSALIPRKAKPSSPAVGDWVASTCQGCTQWCAVQIYRPERPGHAGARQPVVQDQPWLCAARAAT